ncbi:uncharacterized protein LOC102631269 isoform X3 [Citrus sinensis]|uniref:uncharacterized protein LOC102631269 isoform X3 n=1 Tax=Citrus sinensis TaxID=2711 RepID=UPI00076357E6|nr:uncharacterized protein LOC102631269 isoform X3 [Citrus sinensis]
MEKRKRSNSDILNSNSKGHFVYEDLGRRGIIEHQVSKLDTLAGIAIKQANHERTPDHHVQHDLFDSFRSLRLKSKPQWKVSPAMNSLQGYYGLKPTDQRPPSEGCEMAVFRKREAQCSEDCPLLKPSHLYKDSQRKTRSLANFLQADNSKEPDNIISSDFRERESESGEWKDKLVRRRQKSEDDSSTSVPEMLLKEDNSNTGGVPAITGKGLALRPAAASRTAVGADTQGCEFNTVQFVVGGLFLSDRISGVRKSSSTPSFEDQDASSPSPIWHGLPKPISRWKNKAALD